MRAGKHAGGGSSGGGSLNLDDMLSDLTSNPLASLAPGSGGGGGASAAKRKRGLVTPQSGRSSVSSRRSSLASGVSGRAGAGAGRRPPIPSTSWTVRDYEETDAAGGSDGGGAADGMDMDDDFAGVADEGPFDDGDTGASGTATAVEAQQDDSKDVKTAAAAGEQESEAIAADKDNSDDSNKDDSISGVSAATTHATAGAVSGGDEAGEVGAEGAAGATTGAPAAKPRSRFARMKENNDIAVTPAAEAALRPKPPAIVDGAGVNGEGKGAEGGSGGAGGKSSYMPSLEFQGPQYALGDSVSVPTGAVPSTSSWLHKVSIYEVYAWGGRDVLCF